MQLTFNGTRRTVAGKEITTIEAIGAPGTAAAAPALATAVFAATGKRIRQLPLQKALV